MDYLEKVLFLHLVTNSTQQAITIGVKTLNLTTCIDLKVNNIKDMQQLQCALENKIIIVNDISNLYLLIDLGLDLSDSKILNIINVHKLFYNNENKPTFETLVYEYLNIKVSNKALELEMKQANPNYKNKDFLSNLETLSVDTIYQYSLNVIYLIERLFVFFLEKNKKLHDFIFCNSNNLIKIESTVERILLHMKHKGTPFNLDYFNEYRNKEAAYTNKVNKELKENGIDINNKNSIRKYCINNNIAYPFKQENNRNFYLSWLENHKDKMLNAVYKVQAPSLASKIETWSAIKGGKIQPTYDLLGTKTGRITTKEPNIQNLKHNDIKKEFISKNGYTLVSFDFKQIELMLLVHYSNDKSLIDIVNKKEKDFHEEIANMINIDRQVAKKLTFALLYGMSTNSLAKELNISYNEALELKNKFFQKFTFVRNLQYNLRKITKRNGYLETALGRKIYFDTQEKGYLSLNYLCQGGCSDILKQSLVELDKQGWFNIIGYPINLIYDEIVFMVKDNLLTKDLLLNVKNLLENSIKNVYELSVNLQVDISYGKNWGKMETYVI